MVNPKNGSSASQAISKLDPSLRLTRAFASRPPSRYLTEHEIDLSLADQRHHLVDAVGCGAKLAAAMQKREMSCDRRKVERPVQRGVTTANDQEALVAKRLELTNRIED